METKKPDFYVVLMQKDEKSCTLACANFTDACEYMSSYDLAREIKKGNYEFCAHVLVPVAQMFQCFSEDGKLTDCMQTSLYLYGVWQSRKTGKTIYGLTDGNLLKPAIIDRMEEKGTMGFCYGMNMSKVTNVRGMPWFENIRMAAGECEKKYTWVVTVDGSSHGEYENGAQTFLFATYEKAREYVERSLSENVEYSAFNGESHTPERLQEEIKEHCTWYGDDSAQFRYGDAVTDYKIEKVSVPEPDDEKEAGKEE